MENTWLIEADNDTRISDCGCKLASDYYTDEWTPEGAIEFARKRGYSNEEIMMAVAGAIVYGNTYKRMLSMKTALPFKWANEIGAKNGGSLPSVSQLGFNKALAIYNLIIENGGELPTKEENTEQIQCRAPFSGWYTIPTKEKALEHARWMYCHISGRNPVKLINDRFRGIQFTEDELRNVRTD